MICTLQRVAIVRVATCAASLRVLSRAYPIEWARAVHFAVMVYFVVLIAIHACIVFATGVLRNLNPMYAGARSG